MHESEIWLTALFNQYLSGPATSLLQAVGFKVEDPAHPWSNWMTMELLVVALIMILVAAVRSSFSVDKPGPVQHLFEVLYGFLTDSAHESGIHHAGGHVPFFGTLFIFILFSNLIGIIPGFESPTMSPTVPLGCALLTFFYYNFIGIKENGAGKYLAHFAGPMPAMAPLMVPIELVSHMARPLSLTIRLFANMFAGEKVTMAFLGLTYVIAPALFMGLHVFVSFLQAYIFTLMATIYVGGSVAHEEHH